MKQGVPERGGTIGIKEDQLVWVRRFVIYKKEEQLGLGMSR